ncbi:MULTISPECIES: DUF3817 domain-containing protein [unclassified Frondihabitans]|jgi:hypothetical protein|uniref:DUF3817 domain-containing protein n=1 Tax=unclassified Frondihabitans TaxID=2626248 RepID=UPI0006F81DB1|nr:MULTISPECIES: DUF3817 domain-containing protein [unclassified Frondihabitans]KQQ25774.1 hypothetical protein ASF54_15475 [Frondihabitans sp. Leaf304]MBF4574850.1 DUF3817 domain-containing protein [Frondihabitans sp. VKM Ac-2883]RPE77395.1 integral membrane protein [Frondihabitans sp. PhB153]RPF07671.1 integral membrane protein [Frondihabitans sp. PhB161]
MPLKPRPRNIPKIPGAVRLYKISAYVTGVMLLLLCFEMLLKYTGLQTEMAIGDPRGFFVREGTIRSPALDLSLGILIAHGWLYVVYLFTDFRLWSIMRWPFSRFILIALGGVIPLMSFFVERHMAKIALTEYEALQAERETAKATA